MIIGDKMICIDVSGFNSKIPLISIGSIYTLKGFCTVTSTPNIIELEEVSGYIFGLVRFISVVEFRKDKILKIKEKINGNR